MNTKDIKTVEVRAKEYFDKVNGNSYFSMNVTVNYGLKNEYSFYVPMQYGYGNHYEDEAFNEIAKRLNCFKSAKDSVYHRAYDRNNIKYIHSKQEGFKQKDL